MEVIASAFRIISIHALRKESDKLLMRFRVACSYFNPRSP